MRRKHIITVNGTHPIGRRQARKFVRMFVSNMVRAGFDRPGKRKRQRLVGQMQAG